MMQLMASTFLIINVKTILKIVIVFKFDVQFFTYFNAFHSVSCPCVRRPLCEVPKSGYMINQLKMQLPRLTFHLRKSYTNYGQVSEI